MVAPILDHMTALSDPTRCRMLLLLEKHELTVSELCSVLQLPQSTVSRHLKTLADDGWVTSRRDGTSRFYTMPVVDLDAGAARLWPLISEQVTSTRGAEQDERRLRSVLSRRRAKSQEFFASAAGGWDRLRGELFGDEFFLWAVLGLIDPTLVVWEAALTSDGGVPAPAYASYMGIMSPVYDRYFKAGGYPLVEGYTRDDYRKSWQKLVELVGALHKAGVTVVAGTDGQGIELIREIELYKDAGFTPAEALQAATIVPAKMVGADKRTGSIAVGKEGDVVLVDGDVANDLGALRRVVTVVSDGYVMDGDALRQAAGLSGRPK
jgi:DNA-binding transcriptional ArsR family regulator